MARSYHNRILAWGNRVCNRDRDSYKELFVELRNITTVDLTYKAANLLEKILWAFIGIIGTVWAVYFITVQVD